MLQILFLLLLLYLKRVIAKWKDYEISSRLEQSSVHHPSETINLLKSVDIKVMCDFDLIIKSANTRNFNFFPTSISLMYDDSTDGEFRGIFRKDHVYWLTTHLTTADAIRERHEMKCQNFKEIFL